MSILNRGNQRQEPPRGALARKDNSQGVASADASGMSRPELHYSLLTTGLRGLTLFSKLLLTIAIARLFSPAELGLYGIMAASLSFAVVVLGCEFYAFSMREFMVAPREQWPVMLRDQWALYVCGYVVLLPLLSLAFVFDLVPATLMGWFFALVVLEHVSQEATRVLIALSRPLAANLVLFVRSAAWAYPVLAIVLIAEDARDLNNIFLAWLIGVVTSIVLSAWILRRLPWRTAVEVGIDWNWLRGGLVVAKPFLVTAISAISLVVLDRFFIKSYHGMAAVGIYTFFAVITSGLHMLVNTGVSMIRLPRIVRAYKGGDTTAYRHEVLVLFKLTMLATLALGGSMAVAIFPVLYFVGQPVYWDSLPTFFILLVAAMVRCLADVPIYALYAKNCDMRLMIGNVTAFAVFVLANALLVPPLGILGAALAAVAGAVWLLGAIVVAARVWNLAGT